MDFRKFLISVLTVVFLGFCISGYYMIYRVYRKQFPVIDIADDMGILSISASLGEQEWQIMREKVFPDFERKHNCEIRAVNIEAGDTLKKVEVMHKADKMSIDLLFLDNMNLAPYVEKRLVLNLNRYRDAIDPQVYPALVKPLEFNGRLMFFPGRPNVQITYYNTDKFGKDEVPQTWDELLQTAKKLKEDYGVGKIAIHGTLDANTTTQVFEFIEAAGGDITVLNDEGCKKAFSFLQKLYPYLSPESKKANWNTTNKFLSEEAIFIGRNWPFGMNVIVRQNKKRNIKAYGTWSGPEGKATMIGGDVIAITKRSNKHEVALKFAEHLMSREVQEIFVTELGWPPVREDAMGEVPNWQKPFFKAVLDALEYGKYRPTITGWSAVDKYVNMAF
ncbi:MAG: extracellular solute-binding protein, partial [Candidatus Muiribacteriaceae bacterium]